jgi:hypothetical protein
MANNIIDHTSKTVTLPNNTVMTCIIKAQTSSTLMIQTESQYTAVRDMKDYPLMPNFTVRKSEVMPVTDNCKCRLL